MRLRATRHGASPAAKAFTVAVMAAAMLAQMASLSHEMRVRHVRCAEHGELTHVVAMAAPEGLFIPPSPESAFRSGDTGAADLHEHCGVASAIEGSACAPAMSGVASTLAPSPAAAPPSVELAARGRDIVLARAPKTSPPPA